MEEYYIIPETLKFKRQFRFLIFSSFWLFLIVPLSFTTDILKDFVIGVNYILICFLPLWVYNVIFKKGFRYLPIKMKMLFKTITVIIFIYLFLMALQLIINPYNSTFFAFRRLSATVIPSISLALLITFYSFGSQKRQLVMVQVSFIILILIAIFSSMGIGAINEENIIYSTYAGIEREKGIIGSINEYSYYLALLFVLSMAGITNRLRILPNKIIYIPILIFTIMLILQTGSYGAIVLSLLCSVPLLVKISSLKNILSTYIIIPAFIIILWLGVNITITEELNWKARAFISSLSEKSVTPLYEISTILMRYEIIVDGMRRILDKPIVGHGYSDRTAFSASRNSDSAVHNAFIVESLKAGILVGLVMVLFYLRILKYIIHIKQRNIRWVSCSLLLFMFISDNTMTMFSFLSISSGTIAFVLLLMFLVNDLLLKSESAPPSRAN